MNKGNSNVSWAVELLLILIGGLTAANIVAVSIFHIVSTNKPAGGGGVPKLWTGVFLAGEDGFVTVGGASTPYDVPHHGDVVFWDIVTGKQKFVIEQGASVRSVACSPNGQSLEIGEFNGCAKLIDIATGKIEKTITTSGAINSLAISSDNKSVVIGGLDGSITIWRPTAEKSETLVLTNESVLAVAISPDNCSFVATTRSGKAYLFHIDDSGNPLSVMAYGGQPMTEQNAEAVAFVPDGSFITGSQTYLRQWNGLTGKLIRDFPRTSANINCVAVAHNGKRIAVVESNGELDVLGLPTGEPVTKISAHNGTSFGVTFSPNDKQIATIGRDDYAVKLWVIDPLDLIVTLQR